MCGDSCDAEHMYIYIYTYIHIPRCISLDTYVYAYIYIPPLALGHLSRKEAAGHLIVTPGHPAWARGRDVALSPWYFLPWGWWVPPTVQDCPAGGNTAPQEG